MRRADDETGGTSTVDGRGGTEDVSSVLKREARRFKNPRGGQGHTSVRPRHLPPNSANSLAWRALRWLTTATMLTPIVSLCLGATWRWELYAGYDADVGSNLAVSTAGRHITDTVRRAPFFWLRLAHPDPALRDSAHQHLPLHMPSAGVPVRAAERVHRGVLRRL